MQAHLQRVEAKSAVDGNKKLAVKHQLCVGQLSEYTHHVRKEAIE